MDRLLKMREAEKTALQAKHNMPQPLVATAATTEATIGTLLAPTILEFRESIADIKAVLTKPVAARRVIQRNPIDGAMHWVLNPFEHRILTSVGGHRNVIYLGDSHVSAFS